MWHMPVCSRAATDRAASTSRLKTAAERPVFRVVRHANRFVDTVDRDDRNDRTERFLRIDAHLRRDIGYDGRLEVEAMRSSTRDYLRALATASSTCPVTRSTASAVDERADPACLARAGRPPSASPRARQACARTHRRPCGRSRSRSVDIQICPWCMNAPKFAADTARSRSASAKTTSGALPPSSSSTRFR